MFAINNKRILKDKRCKCYIQRTLKVIKITGTWKLNLLICEDFGD